MSEHDLLPEDDPDLRLAQRLDSGVSADRSDPLASALAKARVAESETDDAAAARIWDAIETEIAPLRGRRPHRRATERPARPAAPRRATWATASVVVAATVILAIGVYWRIGPSVEIVASAESEIATWTGPDGSVITLRPHSQLTRLDRSGRSLSLIGEAFFAVAHDAQHPFTVRTRGGDVTVLGTRFNIATWSGPTEVFVEEGRVEVSSGTDRQVLSVGQAATSVRGGTVSRVESVTAETALDWRRGDLAFHSKPAAHVAAELEHHFAIRIDLPENLRAETVSGTLSLADQSDALAQFGRVLDGRFSADARGVFRFVR